MKRLSKSFFLVLAIIIMLASVSTSAFAVDLSDDATSIAPLGETTEITQVSETVAVAQLAETTISAPVLKSLSNTNGGVKFTWSECSGANAYRVYKKASGDKGYTAVAVVGATSYTDTNVTSGKKYTYTVRCVDANGKNCSSYNTGKSITYVKTPEITGFSNTAKGTKITWDNCAGASKYKLFVKSNGKWKSIVTTGKTSYTYEGLKTGTTYTYTVRALDSAGNFISSYNKSGKSYMYISAPALVSLSNTNGGVKFSWNARTGVDRYRVYKKASGDKGYTAVAVVSATSYTDKSVTSGKKYTYTVRCVDANGKNSSYYNTGKSITYVKTPVITGFSNTAKGTKVTWDKCAGASKYKLFVKSNGKWKSIVTTSKTSYTYEGLKNGTTYTYTVRALDSKGNFISSYNKSGYKYMFVSPPKLSGVSKTSNGVKVSWNGNSNASGYSIYRKTLTGSWQLIAKVTSGTSYVDNAYNTKTLYKYTVRCLGENGKNISYYYSDTKYYVNGSAANGKYKVDGNTYYLSNGLFRSGYQTIDGKKYYYNSKGLLQKDGIVGSNSHGWYFADANGVCCESEEIRLAAEYLMRYCKGDTLKERAKYGFQYMADKYPYIRTYDHPKKATDIPKQATDLFKNKAGNCFKYAAAYTCVAKVAGYRARMVIGATSGNPHGWSEVYVDGKWLICDPDANIPSYGRAPYTAYMMKRHYWPLTVNSRHELVIDGSKAVWK